MKDYGVDGVFVQRFVDYTRGDQKNSVPNRILENALEAASKYDRAIAVMYDLSGLRRSGEDCSMIIEDWKRLVDNQKVTNQSGTKTYLHHNGKPVVGPGSRPFFPWHLPWAAALRPSKSARNHSKYHTLWSV